MLGSMRIKMCSIHVKDPATAHAFYTGTLGFDTLMAMPEYNLYIIKDPGASDNSAGLLLEPSDNGGFQRSLQQEIFDQFDRFLEL